MLCGRPFLSFGYNFIIVRQIPTCAKSLYMLCGGFIFFIQCRSVQEGPPIILYNILLNLSRCALGMEKLSYDYFWISYDLIRKPQSIIKGLPRGLYKGTSYDIIWYNLRTDCGQVVKPDGFLLCFRPVYRYTPLYYIIFFIKNQ